MQSFHLIITALCRKMLETINHSCVPNSSPAESAHEGNHL